ncbi:hypothetical protein NJF44_00050 [Pseudomonas guariconensis]|uniref:hypothetical protein n=1 Tax=Pseudomonas TaxID=286 RepID=UPI001CE3ED54|nr:MULTISPECIES: hypothetical protein [Pseudomonas]MCO7635997.1 hypothetical protein [Pseudomonas sp. S 311-6]MCO7513266.1 hypothetical protein [Pseudomonas putida]MCO7563341.1 hypothetical protein [Pseudomonas mosselii]MCO7594746.1 hypothetical protein [Pseudomonas guariconensis]MCO7603634.1 hypothetical protein [Pseudomonas guariconensis]
METVIPNRIDAKKQTEAPLRGLAAQPTTVRQNLPHASLMPVNALYSGGYAISWGVNPCLLDRLKNCQWHKLSQSLFFID